MTGRKQMTGTEFGEKLLQSIREIEAGPAAGQIVLPATLAARVRARTGLSQPEVPVPL